MAEQQRPGLKYTLDEKVEIADLGEVNKVVVDRKGFIEGTEGYNDRYALMKAVPLGAVESDQGCEFRPEVCETHYGKDFLRLMRGTPYSLKEYTAHQEKWGLPHVEDVVAIMRVVELDTPCKHNYAEIRQVTAVKIMK